MKAVGQYNVHFSYPIKDSMEIILQNMSCMTSDIKAKKLYYFKDYISRYSVVICCFLNSVQVFFLLMLETCILVAAKNALCLNCLLYVYFIYTCGNVISMEDN